MFSQKPVDAVAIDDIVQEAGVSKGSFFNYFKEKVEVLHAIRQEVKEKITDTVGDINKDITDPAERVARGLSFYFRLVIDEPNMVRFMLQLDANVSDAIALQVNDGVLSDAREGITSGRFNVPSADSAAYFIVGAGYAGLVNMLNDQKVSSVASLGRHLIVMVLCGLGLENDEANSIAAVAVEQIVRKQGDG